MSDSYDFGKAGEKEAARFYKAAGFTVLFANYRFGKAEIDLVLQKGNLLVVAEVKARKTTRAVVDLQPEKAVNRTKKKLLVYAANALVEELDWEGEIRFDVLALNFFGNQWQTVHFANAFEAYEL